MTSFKKKKTPWEVLESKHLQFEYCIFHRDITKHVVTTKFVWGVVVEGVLGNLYFQELESSYTLDLSYYMEAVLSLDTRTTVDQRHRYKRTFLYTTLICCLLGISYL